MPRTNNGIGTLRESSLHAALKNYYRKPGDAIEEMVDGYHIDIKRGDLLIEIQTRNFSAIKSKLNKLVREHPLLLIHPIAQRKWIVRQDKKGKLVGKRKSPKKGRFEDIFLELMRIPQLAKHPNFQLEIALIEVEEIWLDDGKGSWRRGKWSIRDRHLLGVLESKRFTNLADYLDLIPQKLARPFRTRELSEALAISTSLAGKMSYSLRKMGAIDVVGKDGNAYLLDLVNT